MKTILILPYFGKLPNYFNLYLETVKRNTSVQWLLITDDKTEYLYPRNITVVHKKFIEIKELFQSKFPFEIVLDTAHKLCDYKPAYGYLFEDYLKDYDYWGHCDPDIIWGNFTHFMDWNMLSKYDKIFTFGHLTLYKNTRENNIRFKASINGIERFKVVFTHPIGFAFDEKYGQSINSIFENNSISLFQESYAADVDSYQSNMILSMYHPQTNTYKADTVKKQIFTWENGSVFRYYIKDSNLIKEEFLYIHLQKRSMKWEFDELNYSKILISSNEFSPLEEEITLQNFRKLFTKKWINRQFFKVKWNSFKYKFRYKEYFYGSKKNF